jgi:hypothetical protein
MRKPGIWSVTAVSDLPRERSSSRHERNKDYHAEHYVLPTAERPQTDDRWISERSRIEVKSQNFLKDWINRLKQPDADEFPMDVLSALAIDRLSGKNYLRMKKDIILLHVLGARPFLCLRGLQQPR